MDELESWIVDRIIDCFRLDDSTISEKDIMLIGRIPYKCEDCRKKNKKNTAAIADLNAVGRSVAAAVAGVVNRTTEQLKEIESATAKNDAIKNWNDAMVKAFKGITFELPTIKPKEDVVNDMIYHPAHYMLANGIEVIDVIKGLLTEEQYLGWLLGNALKYQFRAGKKDPKKLIEDYKKAHNFLGILIKTVETQVKED